MIIWGGQQFTCDQRGNGATVLLTKHDGAFGKAWEVYLQGEDAARFCDERDKLETIYPDWHGDQVYAYLWDQLEYGAVAQMRD